MWQWWIYFKQLLMFSFGYWWAYWFRYLNVRIEEVLLGPKGLWWLYCEPVWWVTFITEYFSPLAAVFPLMEIKLRKWLSVEPRAFWQQIHLHLQQEGSDRHWTPGAPNINYTLTIKFMSANVSVAIETIFIVSTVRYLNASLLRDAKLPVSCDDRICPAGGDKSESWDESQQGMLGGEEEEEEEAMM